MHKKEFEKQISELEEEHKNFRVNDIGMFNLQYKANKLFYTILIEFNEKIEEYNRKTEAYNARLLFFTIVIAILTLVMSILSLKEGYSYIKSCYQKSYKHSVPRFP